MFPSQKMIFILFLQKMFACFFLFCFFLQKITFFTKKLQNSEFLLKILTFILSIFTLMSELRLFS